MVDSDLILTKAITLLYRESQLEQLTENSSDLVRTAIEKIAVSEVDIGIATQRNTTRSLKDLVSEMLKNPVTHAYTLDDMLQQVRLVTNGNANLYAAIEQGISNELAPTILRRTITNLKKTLHDFFRQQKIAELFKKASRDWNFNPYGITDPDAYIRNIITELEVTSSKTMAKDPGLIKSLDLTDDESLQRTFEEVASSNTDDLPFKTGFQELNMALQGGPRPGDTMFISALQHNYKTGFSLSVFADIPLYNKPKCKDLNKKPLCYRISAEDPLRNNAQFLYQKLKFEETGEIIDIKGVSIEEMSSYIKRRMSANGYHVIIDEVNPDHWTYQSIINRILELEAQGYCVEVFSIDYLSKIPTTGCRQGAMGDDLLDMITKIRNAMAARGILFISPHQLSTEAKRLLQTVPADQFLYHIKGGGFFERTKGLDRIYDIGLLLHKVESGTNGDYLHVVVDKHRFPTVVDSSLKSFFLPFPQCKAPIPANVNKENHKILRKIPKSFASDANHDNFFSV